MSGRISRRPLLDEGQFRRDVFDVPLVTIVGIIGCVMDSITIETDVENIAMEHPDRHLHFIVGDLLEGERLSLLGYHSGNLRRSDRVMR